MMQNRWYVRENMDSVSLPAIIISDELTKPEICWHSAKSRLAVSGSQKEIATAHDHLTRLSNLRPRLSGPFRRVYSYKTSSTFRLSWVVLRLPETSPPTHRGDGTVTDSRPPGPEEHLLRLSHSCHGMSIFRISGCAPPCFARNTERLIRRHASASDLLRKCP